MERTGSIRERIRKENTTTADVYIGTFALATSTANEVNHSSFKALQLVGHYNVLYYHTKPLIRNIMSNAIYRAFSGDEEKGNIIVNYRPIVILDHVRGNENWRQLQKSST